MLFGVLFNFPDASTTLTNIGAYSAPTLTDFLPIIYLIGGIGIAVVGVLLAVVAVAWLVRILTHHN